MQGDELGQVAGVPATGRAMVVDEVWFFTIAEGHLCRMWSLEDTWARLLQLGTAQRALETAGESHPP